MAMFFIGYLPPYNRGFLHSFLASLTIDPILALFLTPFSLFLIKKIFNFSYSIKDFIIKLNFKDYILSVLSSFSHVLIDSLHHLYNPVFMPFTKKSFNKLLLFNDWVKASFIMQFIFGALSIAILIYESEKAKSFKAFIESTLVK
jgi:membrane-bound metal-dependent hydrolase YbcI (DUF457 family)